MLNLRLMGLCLWAVLMVAEVTAADRKPNVVFILADDLGWTDLGCYGSRYYETPNIDRLAAQGMKFNFGYSCGLNCQPTRAALMSGQYGPRTGIYTVGGTDRFDSSQRPLVPVENVEKLKPSTITVAETLKDNGYATGMFGKWHLGQDDEHHPLKQGFDEAIVSMGKHFDFATSPKVKVAKGEYLADFLTDKALDFMTKHRSEPFFLYLPHFGVHSPHEAKPELIAKFKDKPAVGGHHDPTSAAMIASVDESVGRVLAKLDELKLSDNTLVIFSSDNGGVGGYLAAGIGKAGAITDNSPLRGGKGMLYEGGVRVPYLFRWPGRIAAGQVSEEPIASIDLYPTLAEVTGSKLPTNRRFDGQSYLSLLTGRRDDWKARALYWHFPGYLGAGQDQWRTTPAGAIQVGHMKLLEFFEDQHIELYDLKADVGQQRDLSKTQPEQAAEMLARLKEWRQAINAPMPTRREPRDASRKPAGGKKRKSKAND